ncbi:DUF2793 domain-containing protein [Lysobacter sp. Root96]|uniref:DUF2793 domain-containing protein n=1 Tax=Lysobacter sp. Root96 TaxID=1736612 RepID=UPI0006F26303|nr:DUF2793 domain-containing protein [Lysobacter sp. Root96]KRD71457.1 hypothetical protein ASE45_06510 [Lysobacter sp. Root96]
MSIPLTTWPDGALQGNVPVNDSFQALAVLVQGAIETETATPPTTTAPDVGKAWIVGTSATGVWATHDGEIALCTAADVWRFFEPREGWFFRDKTANRHKVYDGAAWALFTTGELNFAAITTVSGTSHDLALVDAGCYLRFTNISTKTLTVRDNADIAIPTGYEFHGRNAGAGLLTIIEDAAVTIAIPSGGTLEVPEGGTFTLKKVDTDDWDLFGVTVAA